MKRIWMVVLLALLVTALCMAVVRAEEADVPKTLTKDGYYVLDNDGDGAYSTGDTVYLGSYPQSRVEDEAQLEMLNVLLDDSAWESYGFYAENEQRELAFYQDVALENGIYRAVRLDALRPWYANLPADREHSNVDDNGFSAGAVYWFRFEPIEWTILSIAQDGNVLLSAVKALDSQPYQDVFDATGKSAVIVGTDIYTNNWENSSIRAFLNGAFAQTAFSETQAALIQSVTLDNVNSTANPDHKYARDQMETEDRVFLLSYADLLNPDYGFSTKASYSKETQGDKINDADDPTVLDAMRKRRGYSDYSMIMGVRTSQQATTVDGEPALAWMLRSPGATSTAIYMVNKYGSLQTQKAAITNENLVDCLSYNATNAVVPAICVTLKRSVGEWQELNWEYEDAVGEIASLPYYLYVPAAWEDGQPLPLVTWIADASMLGKTSSTLLKQKAPILWTKEEKIKEQPVFFLTFGFDSAGKGYDDHSAMGQIVPIVDTVAQQYGIDTDRLYLTGQSFGGIADFTLNMLYPDKWAATYYVACQPGGSGQIEGDAQAEAVMTAKAFEGQSFVYIAAMLDEKAYPGQQWIKDALDADGIAYDVLDELKYKDKAIEEKVGELLSQGSGKYFIGYAQLTKSGASDSEHMETWRYAYSIDAVWEWLLSQSR